MLLQKRCKIRQNGNVSKPFFLLFLLSFYAEMSLCARININRCELLSRGDNLIGSAGFACHWHEYFFSPSSKKFFQVGEKKCAGNRAILHLFLYLCRVICKNCKQKYISLTNQTKLWQIVKKDFSLILPLCQPKSGWTKSMQI